MTSPPSTTLISVQDGDTFTLSTIGPPPIHSRIRLADIDAPERGEALFTQSRDHLRSWLLQCPPELIEPLPLGWRYDQLNRLIAYVTIGQKLLQLEQVTHGFAVVWTPQGPGQFTDQLHAAQSHAQACRHGVWSLPHHRLHDPAVKHRRKGQPTR